MRVIGFSEHYNGFLMKKKLFPAGFGSYRTGFKHAGALSYALSKGVNLIDTSANYLDGESEKMIGSVLKKEIEEGKIKREDVFIVSKGGYIQGTNLINEDRKRKDGNPYQEVVFCGSALRHCINPQFLKDQISESLERLQTSYIDYYLLHNPEYFLLYTPADYFKDLKTEYYRRIKVAFEFLESEVAAGRIKNYGISSNTFVISEGEDSFTSLEKICEISEQTGKENHFAMVQFPLNLNEKGGVVNLNQENGTSSVLKYAGKKGLKVLINRPLNSILKGQIERLADFPVEKNLDQNNLQTIYSKLSNIESELRELVIYEIKSTPEKVEAVRNSLNIASYIKNNIEAFKNPVILSDIYEYYIEDKLSVLNTFSDSYGKQNDALTQKKNEYTSSVRKMFEIMASILAGEENKKNEKIHEKLSGYLPAKYRNLSLSAKSLLLIMGLKEVSCVLLGMRKEEYVNEAADVAALDKIKITDEFWFLER